MEHETLTEDDAEYWDFSFDEMAKYDLPGFIDHILGHTGFESVGYWRFDFIVRVGLYKLYNWIQLSDVVVVCRYHIEFESFNNSIGTLAILKGRW